MPYREEFQIANPSPYVRSDYVDVDLASLNTPHSLDVTSLRLLRSLGNGCYREVPYQIDWISGRENERRVLTFFSSETPPASDDYTQPSLTYLLEEAAPDPSIQPHNSQLLKIDYYYANRLENEPEDGYGGTQWDTQRPVYNVKFRNGNLEFAFSLVPHLGVGLDINYTGSATNVFLRDAAQYGAGEMLSPFEDASEKRWGQLRRLVFFSLPWELKWFHDVNLLGIEYELVWANSGPIRAVTTIRTPPFELSFDGRPYLDAPISFRARLYRTLYVYPLHPYYVEELYVISDRNTPLAFRPYYSSIVKFPPGVPANIARFEHIPDYFALWRQFAGRHFGYGFAADAHVRGIEAQGDLLQWRIQLTYHKKCVHYFMFTPWRPYVSMQDPYNIIGHHGWYERVYKPLERIPLFKPHYPFPE